MIFSKRVFFWSGVYGCCLLVPMLFLEQKLGQDFPPASNHPEQYYGFLGVAIAWQIAFILISTNPIQYRLMMLPAIAEKLLSGIPAAWLYLTGRIDEVTTIPFVVDLLIGCLFIAGYYVTSREANKQTSSIATS